MTFSWHSATNSHAVSLNCGVLCHLNTTVVSCPNRVGLWSKAKDNKHIWYSVWWSTLLFCWCTFFWLVKTSWFSSTDFFLNEICWAITDSDFQSPACLVQIKWISTNPRFYTPNLKVERTSGDLVLCMCTKIICRYSFWGISSLEKHISPEFKLNWRAGAKNSWASVVFLLHPLSQFLFKLLLQQIFNRLFVFYYLGGFWRVVWEHSCGCLLKRRCWESSGWQSEALPRSTFENM